MRRSLGDGRRPLLFLLVGAWNTLFGYGSFVAFYWLALRLGLHYLFALVVSNAVAIANSYWTYRTFVFETKEACWAEFSRFLTVYAGLFVYNLVALPALVHFTPLGPAAAQAVVTVVALAGTYVAHNLFSFRTSPADRL